MRQDVDFAPHYNWTSHKAMVHRPRQLSNETRQTIIGTLLRADRQFLDLIHGQCKGRWAVAVRLDMGNLRMSLFDMDELKQPRHRPLARLMDYDDAFLVAVDHSATFTELRPEEREAVLTIRPFLYADRALKPSEQTIIANLSTPDYPVASPVRAAVEPMFYMKGR